MVVKSRGPRKRTREKFRRSTRTPINEFLKKFEIGDKVVIDINSSSISGMPFRRFQGLSGKIIKRRGKAFLVQIKDGRKIKEIIANPEHLKKI
ncbi:MAG: 50S ribosomal protein L21e [Candidatus Aenigmarchaeota archaeon]|nr:50S ribosomal protein L21e [Candidatus Aenigmarchaeota archaeon]